MEKNMTDSSPEIIIYGTSWCGATKRAVDLLERNSITFKYIDIDKDKDARKFVEETNHGYRSVPTIIFPDGSILVEPTNSQLAQKVGVSVKL
jgi:mycoredoxin